MNNTNDEYYHLRDVIYELGDVGPKDIHVCICILDLIEARLSDDDFDFDDYILEWANNEWNAAFQNIGSHERITDPKVIANLPVAYDFIEGDK